MRGRAQVTTGPESDVYPHALMRSWTPERAVVAGIGGFGALFAANWAVSKV